MQVILSFGPMKVFCIVHTTVIKDCVDLTSECKTKLGTFLIKSIKNALLNFGPSLVHDVTMWIKQQDHMSIWTLMIELPASKNVAHEFKIGSKNTRAVPQTLQTIDYWD